MDYKNVDVNIKANVYYDGRVTSRTVTTSSGERKTLGVMLPGSYRFNTDTDERMEVTQGRCRVRVAEGAAKEYRVGESFSVPGRTYFDIEVIELLDYVCHFA